MLGDRGNLSSSVAVKFVTFIPGCVLHARALAANLIAALVLAYLLHPEARSRGIEEPKQAEMFVLECVCRQLNHRCGID